MLQYMQNAYGLDDTEKRKLSFLYKHSGIQNRYSVVDDFSKTNAETFISCNSKEEFPSLERRMEVFGQHALPLSVQAIEQCIKGIIEPSAITHLITVSCTGMSAPGLDLQIVEAMELPSHTFRTSVNFMGCYAAIHALKLAKMICDSTPGSNVVIVATELCTLHFQKEYTPDNAASTLLFGDGCAAALISNKLQGEGAVSLNKFFSQVAFKGKSDMAWELSSKGFLMTLSSYVPRLIEEDIAGLVKSALENSALKIHDITHWCIHPGGRKILDIIQKQLNLSEDDLCFSREVLSRYGNMSSSTILFVLKKLIDAVKKPTTIFGVAFGPGLTMETFIASN